MVACFSFTNCSKTCKFKNTNFEIYDLTHTYTLPLADKTSAIGNTGAEYRKISKLTRSNFGRLLLSRAQNIRSLKTQKLCYNGETVRTCDRLVETRNNDCVSHRSKCSCRIYRTSVIARAVRSDSTTKWTTVDHNNDTHELTPLSSASKFSKFSVTACAKVKVDKTKSALCSRCCVIMGVALISVSRS